MTRFFRKLLAAGLPALAEMKGDQLGALRQSYARLSGAGHVMRRNLDALKAIASICAIEGKW